MQNISFKDDLQIEGLKIIEPFVFNDERGCFRKPYEHNIFKANGLDFEISEIDESVSKKGVLRGMHMQHTAPQHKLIRCISGEIFDVAVDARKGSATFGKYASVVLSAENQKMFYIPAGFFHGFLALRDNTVVNYVCAVDYNKAYDGGFIWNDKDINIAWPPELIGKLIISEKDKNLPSFSEYCGKYLP